MAYLIQGAALTAIANQARRLTGTSGQLTPAQMATALSGVTTGGFTIGEKSSSPSASDCYICFDYRSGRYELSISLPTCSAISSDAFNSDGHEEFTTTAHFMSCMSVGYRAFQGCRRLTTLTLNSGCAIGQLAFADVLAPNDKTFRLYLRGNSVGTCEDSAFDIWDATSSEYSSHPYDVYSGAIPGLEIYVPSSLINAFRTTWCNGHFADNIYALTD